MAVSQIPNGILSSLLYKIDIAIFSLFLPRLCKLIWSTKWTRSTDAQSICIPVSLRCHLNHLQPNYWRYSVSIVLHRDSPDNRRRSCWCAFIEQLEELPCCRHLCCWCYGSIAAMIFYTGRNTIKTTFSPTYWSARLAVAPSISTDRQPAADAGLVMRYWYGNLSPRCSAGISTADVTG